ncbi:DgyrCDS5492 [Dimorphilus gyrociliatus]|uniref:GDP-D-glucose phosphorylase 1 n=1 Tax=Dimorphilus gyrociliatus TaxID=2664684 RepID=A0A7I8VK21_9ANNE|nr:DgyrCDS5492 [Dimorphilus gyrociliatus]
MVLYFTYRYQNYYILVGLTAVILLIGANYNMAVNKSNTDSNVYVYESSSFIEYSSNWSVSSFSKFDELLRSRWEERMKVNCFKYSWKKIKTKVLGGKYHFVIQLNPDRANKRKATVTGVSMPFDTSKFHFGKVLSSCESPADKHYLIINVNPFDFGHFLIVPNLHMNFPQRLSITGARMGIETILMTNSPAFRVGFNSLGAVASVNHQHLHGWYLNHPLYIETARGRKISKNIFEIVDAPIPAIALQKKDLDVMKLAILVHSITEYLYTNEIAHNLLMTRGTNFESDEDDRRIIRIIIWPRKSTFHSTTTAMPKFYAALLEFAGQIPVYNTESFEDITEEEIISGLQEYSLTGEKWNTVIEDIVKFDTF